MKNRIRKKAYWLLLGLCIILLKPLTASAESPTADITMVVASSSYTYSAAKAVTANRAEYVTFGQELEVIEYGSEWSRIVNNGKERYILSKNLEYCDQTIVKNRVMVSKGAYACSASSTLGYAYYGTDVHVLGETTTKKGVTYVHCIVPKTYQEDGKTVKGENVEGYINKAYLTEKSTPKVVNGGTNLYANAYGASSPDSLKKVVGYIYTGDEVRVLMSNKTWSKILFEGKVYYMSTAKLEPLRLYITVNRAMQTVDAKPGSGYLHYVYWNTPITVLGTYESEKFGTYYYCKVSGDYGFVREYSTKGLQYVGYNQEMLVNTPTTIYAKADTNSASVYNLKLDDLVKTEYGSDTWVRVVYEGKQGYVLRDKLYYPSYNVNGKSYSTAYQLYKKRNGKQVDETVVLLAQNAKYGYAYVQNESGKEYWTQLGALKQISQTQTYYTCVPSVTLHTQASNDSEEIQIPYMTPVQAEKLVIGGWTKVSYNGKTYYIWLEEGILTEQESTYQYDTNTAYQKAVVEKAMDIYRNWDTKYVHGQSNGIADSDGKYGFDCSGFASYVINEVMQQDVPTYRISANLQKLYETTDMYNKGYTGAFASTFVSRENLQPGDVLFFYVGEESDAQTAGLPYNHCGIYLGNGEFIHCTRSWGGGVCIMPLNTMYEEGLIGIKRYLPQKAVPADQTMYTTSRKTNVYPTKNSDTEPITTLGIQVPVVLKYTDNGNWAYVEYSEGKYGYILIKYLS